MYSNGTLREFQKVFVQHWFSAQKFGFSLFREFFTLLLNSNFAYNFEIPNCIKKPKQLPNFKFLQSK